MALYMIRDILHLKAPGNWINDPNGFIYYHGKYHLFYQHFPYAPVWGTMHWGHAVSEDLVHWEHLDIALFPTKGYDRNGVFSGSALEKDGKMYLYYSAVRYLETDEEDIHRAAGGKFETSQAMLVSEDGYHFDNWNRKRQIIPVIRDGAIGHAVHTRDPKVWFEDGTYYMLLGSTYEEKSGRVLFYTSTDGETWEYASQYPGRKTWEHAAQHLVQSVEEQEGPSKCSAAHALPEKRPADQCPEEQAGMLGRIMECPDLFRLGETYVFMGSPMYIGEAGKGYENLSICTLAEFDRRTCGLKLSGAYQYVDYGMDLYAPQTNVDKDGRRVMIGWMRMPKAVEEDGKKPWNGMMCIPRVIEAENGHIFFRVHPEFDRYFSKEAAESAQPWGENFIPQEAPCRIQAVLEEGEELDIGGYRIRKERGAVKTDRSRVFRGIEGPAAVCGTPEGLEQCSLDIFVEPNLIEVFINGGQYVISNVVYDLGSRVTGKIAHIFMGNDADGS